jgi:osmoprotectant transport system ATP-binding protein
MANRSPRVPKEATHSRSAMRYHRRRMSDSSPLREGPSSAESLHRVEIAFHEVSFASKSGRPIISKVSFTVEKGETLVLLGRSGSGKTTALKLINRLYDPTAGEIIVQGRSTTEWDPIHLRRSIGYVIQESGLFPHYTAEKNIGLVPQLEKWPRERIGIRVEQLLSMVGLTPHEFRNRYPHQLSGGQRQRVGVARALAADPAILLMDEPFGALDPITRSELQHEFLSLQRQLAKTVILVTHDLREALLLGTRIALLEDGEIVTIAPHREFIHSTNSSVQAFVKPFLEAEQLLHE